MTTSSKLSFKYTFDLVPLSLELPYHVVSKLKPKSQFYLIWKRAQDTPIQSEIVTVDKSQLNNKNEEEDKIDTSKAIQWVEHTRTLSLQTVLMKDQKSIVDKREKKYLTKESRLLLKQVKSQPKQKDSTIGYVSLDLSQLSHDSQTTRKLALTKCNIENVFLNVRISARDDNNNDQKFENKEEEEEEEEEEKRREKSNDHELIESMSVFNNDDDNDDDNDDNDGDQKSDGSNHHHMKLDENNLIERMYLKLQQKYKEKKRKNEKYKQRIRVLITLATNLKAQQKTDKHRISNMEEQLQRNAVKYTELISYLNTNNNNNNNSNNHSSLIKFKRFTSNHNNDNDNGNDNHNHNHNPPHSLIKKQNEMIANLLKQNEDLEQTLVMVRNSWSQTANVMQSQIDLLKSQMESQTMEHTETNDHFKQLTEEHTELEEQCAKMQIEKICIEKQISDLQLKLAQQTIGHTALLSKYTDASQKVRQMKGVISKMLQGFTNEKNEHVCLIQGCCGESDHQKRMTIKENGNGNGNGNEGKDENEIVDKWDLKTVTHGAITADKSPSFVGENALVNSDEKSEESEKSDNGGTVIEVGSDRSEMSAVSE